MNLQDLPPSERHADVTQPTPTAGVPGRPGAEAADGATVLAVDDTPTNLGLLASVLSPHWRVKLANSGAKALELARRQPPDLIILDVMMPGQDGWETCRQLKADPRTRDIPVLFLTALAQPADEAQGFACGAADFIHKPFNPALVRARVAAQIEAKRWRDALAGHNQRLQQDVQAGLAQVERLREATLQVMISFAEFRDETTGHHVRRTQEYVQLLATWLQAQDPGRGLTADEIAHLARSAPLHDVGKVAIPDPILLKPGPLTTEEMAVMRTHAMHGYEILRRAAARMGDDGPAYLRHAMDIARHHHERWDGSGYPDGLAGEAIPLSARLMAVADVYDALISRRPYKAPRTHEQAMAYLEAESGRHFDPAIVEAARQNGEGLRRIARDWADDEPAAGPADAR